MRNHRLLRVDDCSISARSSATQDGMLKKIMHVNIEDEKKLSCLESLRNVVAKEPKVDARFGTEGNQTQTYVYSHISSLHSASCHDAISSSRAPNSVSEDFFGKLL